MRIPKTKKRDSEKPTLQLHGVFTPPGDDKSPGINEFIVFWDIWCKARDLQISKGWREVRARERKLHEQRAWIPKFVKVLRPYLDGEIDAYTVARRIKKICRKPKLQRELLDFLAAANLTAPRSEDGLAKERRDITHGEQLLRVRRQSTQSVNTLAEYAAAGEKDAIKGLVQIAQHAIESLMLAERMHPKAAREIAGGQSLWPLLASLDPNWERIAVKRVQGLELGKELAFLRTPFRAARGTDENYPARKWAKVAVRAIEETRRRYLTYGDLRAEFEELIFKGEVSLALEPDWVERACRLPQFSEATARKWGNVIREMIREQVPDFHTRQEWENQRNTARHNRRGTRGEIQNAILDDIVSALRRIAPLATLPKSTS